MLARALTRHAAGRLAKRVPALKFLAVGDIALLARRHIRRLEPAERRRVRELLARAARDRSLKPRDRRELERLARKMDPRAFAGGVADALSPVPLPRRLREGPRRRGR
jgi:hypothetical protein